MPKIARIPVIPVALALLLWTAVSSTPSAATPAEKPEDVGFSTERLRRIDELVQRGIDGRSFSGAVTLVARNGHIAHFEAHGLMDIDTGKPMQKDAIFRIMSMTKPVVGVSILMLVEEGKIRLTDPVSRFIPELRELKVAVPQAAPAGPPQPPGAPPAEPRFYTVPADREITIRDLLTHTSGLASGTISTSEARKVALTGKETLADYIPRLGSTPLEFQPGTRWAYSAQAGFDVLARVVEIVSGQPYDQFARTRLFEPLGMKDTFFYPDDGNPRMVTLYSRRDNGLQKRENPDFMNGAYFSGAGGLFSTAEDYLQFAQMLVNGGELDGRRFLAPRTVELMGSVYVPDTLPGRQRGEGYGLSVRVISSAVDRDTFLSDGSFGWSGLFGTHFWVDPKEKIVGIFMAQTADWQLRDDFQNAVMHALVGGSALSTN